MIDDSASLGTFDTGSLVQLTGTFKNAGGTLTNPTAVVCTVRDPAGAVTTPAPSSSSTGIWTANVDLTGAVAGVWFVRWAGTGAVQASEEGWFFVEASQV
jgi:hypothetical protein